MSQKSPPKYRRGEYQKEALFCEVCGKECFGTSRKKYCSEACKHQARLARQREKEGKEWV